jgi:hypothetical protein
MKVTLADWYKWKTEFQDSKTKLILKKKTEEFLDERLKSCKGICKNSVTPSKDQMCDSWGIKEGKEVQAKGIGNIVNKIKAENFPNLEKEMPFQDTKQT